MSENKPIVVDLASYLQPQKTLRDEFAMAALTGMWADPNLDWDCAEFAKMAYKAADAMLAERLKEKP